MQTFVFNLFTQHILVQCGECSPVDCTASIVPSTAGYSAGPLVLIENGRDVHKSSEMNSCPNGYKIWSPRNKNDWTVVWRAMKASFDNYPRNPSLIIDVTNPVNSAAPYGVMKSGQGMQTWQTTDGSDWWLRDERHISHSHNYLGYFLGRWSSSYTPNCYMNITQVNPSNVSFEHEHGRCAFHSKDYFCQPKNGTWLGAFNCPVALHAHRARIHHTSACARTDWGRCRHGSSKICTVTPVVAPGYSAGPLLRVSDGKKVTKSTDPNSCPYGYKIWSPRSEKDWKIVRDAMVITDAYPRAPDLIVDVTKPSDSSKKSTENWNKNEFQTSDGSAWWLPDGANGTTYKAHCYLKLTTEATAAGKRLRAYYNKCNTFSTSYLCQPIEKGTFSLE